MGDDTISKINIVLFAVSLNDIATSFHDIITLSNNRIREKSLPSTLFMGWRLFLSKGGFEIGGERYEYEIVCREFILQYYRERSAGFVLAGWNGHIRRGDQRQFNGIVKRFCIYRDGFPDQCTKSNIPVQ